MKKIYIKYEKFQKKKKKKTKIKKNFIFKKKKKKKKKIKLCIDKFSNHQGFFEGIHALSKIRFAF